MSPAGLPIVSNTEKRVYGLTIPVRAAIRRSEKCKKSDDCLLQGQHLGRPIGDRSIHVVNESLEGAGILVQFNSPYPPVGQPSVCARATLLGTMLLNPF